MDQKQSARNEGNFPSTPSVDHRLDRETRASVSWRLPLAIAGVLLVGDSASGESDIYGYVGTNGVFEMTNVPTDRRFRPADLRGSRLSHRASVEEVEAAVDRYARQFNLHPALLLAVIKAESDFNPTVISRAGAVGLMQLIPETAIRHGVENLYDTGDNIRGGARHLRYLLDRFNGNIRLAVAAYNAGERRVERYHAIPPYPETRDYVRKVMMYYQSFRGDYQAAPGTAVLLAMHKGLQLESVPVPVDFRTARPVAKK
ncbi:MAG: lytic transglycosylase domain-containing protein [Nitrospira sp.]|nr:lytic transglycosylase domain-containing protein [Nitrospira sp.]